MPGHDIIVIGASAGGVEALTQLVAGLPADLPAAVFIVLHIPPDSRSRLPEVLQRATRLPTAHAVDGEPVLPGRVYVAPPDLHMLLDQEHVRVVPGPKENRARPALDPLFRSAAHSYGARVVGVVLTGALDDGTAGLLAIRMHGGIAIVQDPEEALFADMPRSALENVGADHCLPVHEIPKILTRLAASPADSPKELTAMSLEISVDEDQKFKQHGRASVYTCPECHGTLWELEEGNIKRFRCRIGHAFSPLSLEAEQNRALDELLWAALRALEENAALMEQLGNQAIERTDASSSVRFKRRAQERLQQADTMRQLLIGNPGDEPPELSTG